MSRALLLACGASQRARSTAPTVLAREMYRPALRPHRSAIVRLRSGAVASRSGAFRIAAFRCGGGGPRGWHGRAGATARRSLRPRLPVRRKMCASSAHGRHPARSEYLPSPVCRPCAAMRASRRSCALRPRSRRASAGALVAHVRFCGARPAHLNLSKVSALALDCAEIFLSFANATHISSRANKGRSGLESWRCAAPPPTPWLSIDRMCWAAAFPAP